MAVTGLGRGTDYYPVRTVTEHSGARYFREEETRLIIDGVALSGAG